MLRSSSDGFRTWRFVVLAGALGLTFATCGVLATRQDDVRRDAAPAADGSASPGGHTPSASPTPTPTLEPTPSAPPPGNTGRGGGGSGSGSRCTRTLSTGTVRGFTVPAGQTWCFDPNTDTTVTSTGNVIVRGRLRMRPSGSGTVHTLRFTGFTERQFQGGGNDPVPTDIGLWVAGSGSLDLVGTSKRGWTRLSGSAASGARRLALQGTLTGWRAGDQLMIAPTQPPTVSSSSTRFDVVTIASVGSGTVTLRDGLRYPHPRVNVWTAEVANLTRNVRIEGENASHRSHVWIRSSSPQTIRNVAIRYMGPRKDANGDGTPEFVAGRYGLHFHRSENGSRGSIVESVVVRDAGSHAFVPHASNGITFRDTITYNTMEDPYWFDPEPRIESEHQPPSPVEAPDDTVYDRALAALATKEERDPGVRMTGFWLGAGRRNVVRNSAAVGIIGGRDSSGFQWPEDRQAVWTFENNIAHNNLRHGIFVWQNSPLNHVITRFAGYHNGFAGIRHGAYNNRYTYRDSILWGNGRANLALRAESKPSPLLTFARITLNGAGITPYGYLLEEPHPKAGVPGSPAVACGNTLTGHTGANYHIEYTGPDDTLEERLDIRSRC